MVQVFSQIFYDFVIHNQAVIGPAVRATDYLDLIIQNRNRITNDLFLARIYERICKLNTVKYCVHVMIPHAPMSEYIISASRSMRVALLSQVVPCRDFGFSRTVD